MKFMAVADTDIGKRRKNQDSLLIRQTETPSGDVLLCAVCDGLGGLARGELASATLVRTFSEWFDREICGQAPDLDPVRDAGKWESLLNDANRMIRLYGEDRDIRLGSTFSGIMFAGDRFLICHIGDSRVYHIGGQVRQLTEDQTLAAQEVRAGRLTQEQARTDRRRSILTQCVGVFTSVEPQRIVGKAEPGVYLLCSDGFCHETTERRMGEMLSPDMLPDRRTMHKAARHLINQAKAGGETDNISAIVVRLLEEPAEGDEREKDIVCAGSRPVFTAEEIERGECYPEHPPGEKIV